MTSSQSETSTQSDTCAENKNSESYNTKKESLFLLYQTKHTHKSHMEKIQTKPRLKEAGKRAA